MIRNKRKRQSSTTREQSQLHFGSNLSSLLPQHCFVIKKTLNCAVNFKCIPCLHKIFPEGTPGLPQNIRPECCKRSQDVEYHGLYKGDLKILILGDGDFSFSLAIAKELLAIKCYPSAVVLATSYDPLDVVLKTYPTAESNLNKLSQYGAVVHHNVDATNLSSSTFLEAYKIGLDYVLWNFPCIASSDGADAQYTEVEINKNLLRQFFKNVTAYLKTSVDNQWPGEVHVTHKTIEPFSWWRISDLGEQCGLRNVATVVFDKYLYPGYVNRKVWDKKSFPIHDARTYIFTAEGSPDISAAQYMHSRYDCVSLGEESVRHTLLVTVCSHKQSALLEKPPKKKAVTA